MIKLNNAPINVTKFPDNTSQVWKVTSFSKTYNIICWYFESENEIILLAQLKALLDSKGLKVNSLYIDYLPYARQDKDISNDSTFALIPFANILNSLNFKSIEILDPHSKRALELIKNSSASYFHFTIQNVLKIEQPDVICFPDAGACSKYSGKLVYTQYLHITGSKVREQSTGHITNYTVDGDVVGKNVVIVDDICDGGATFVILTKKLIELGANRISLLVTHGLFTKGKDILYKAGISAIYSKDFYDEGWS